MRTILKFRFGLAALILAGIVTSSCTREDEDLDEEKSWEMVEESLPPKKSAIYKHLADHEKERTRVGKEVELEPEVSKLDTEN